MRTQSPESRPLSQVTGGKNEPALMSVLHSEKTIPKFICTSNIYLGIQITRLLGTGMSVLKENPKAGFRGRGGSQSHGPSSLSLRCHQTQRKPEVERLVAGEVSHAPQPHLCLSALSKKKKKLMGAKRIPDTEFFVLRESSAEEAMSGHLTSST